MTGPVKHPLIVMQPDDGDLILLRELVSKYGNWYDIEAFNRLVARSNSPTDPQPEPSVPCPKCGPRICDCAQPPEPLCEKWCSACKDTFWIMELSDKCPTCASKWESVMLDLQAQEEAEGDAIELDEAEAAAWDAARGVR